MTTSKSETISPYRSTNEHIEAEIDRIDAILEFHLTDPHADQEGDGEYGTPVAGPDPTTQVGVDPQSGPVITESTLRDAIADRADRIDDRLERSREEDCCPRFDALTQACDLSRLERDLLLLALLPDLYEGYETLYAALQETTPPTLPTVGLLVRLLEPTVDSRDDLLIHLVDTAPLRTYDLLELTPPDYESSHLLQVVTVDPHIRAYLTGHDHLDPELVPFVTLEEPDTTLEDLSLADDVVSRIESIRDATSDRTALYVCYGPDGAGRNRAPGVLRSPETPVLRADLDRLVAYDLLDRFTREAKLRDAAVHLETASVLVEGDWRDRSADPSAREERDGTVGDPEHSVDPDTLLEFVDELPNDIFLTTEERWIPDVSLEDHEFSLIEFPAPEYDLQRSLWAEHEDVLPESVTPTELAGVFDLTQEEIDRAVSAIRALRDDADRCGDDLDRFDVYEGCKSQSASNLASLAEHLEPGYTWDEIVLPESTERQLRQVSAHITERYTVYDEWGFESRFSRGTGVVALFSGPSGTGKTMAAEILANESGLDLYKVDLSSVVSKYIGETEENLERIFEEAERSNAILLFDEADAIFGERSEVSDSTDRYANVEVNYLLQRIERYDGVVLLTTNYESNIDEAFQRRIHLSVTFATPDEDQRQAIWESIFPKETPVGDLDYEFLSTFELTGGNIRNVAQTAAFMAASGAHSHLDTEDVDDADITETEAENTEADGDEDPSADDEDTADDDTEADDDAGDDTEADDNDTDRGDTDDLTDDVDDDGVRAVEMVDVVNAIKREYEKKGRLIDPVTFEPYRDELDP